MIIDIHRFIENGRPYWAELEQYLQAMDQRAGSRLSVEDVCRLHHLYQRCSADLASLSSFTAERATREYLETLVSRAYSEIHETRHKAHRLAPLRWLIHVLPCTFRTHIRAFQLASLITVAGCAFGGIAISVDPEAKATILPFDHLLGDPSERVEHEEETERDHMQGSHVQGAAWYWTHNTKVSLTTMAMGFSWGVGTIILLFYNGIILGAVMIDYILAGETTFLMGWLLPHGATEIPAILVAGQAGLVLAGAMLGWRESLSLRERMRKVAPDLVTLVFGVILLLFWAGIIEAFLSQYHAPVIPYAFKIGFGVIELVMLTLYLALSGRKEKSSHAT